MSAASSLLFALREQIPHFSIDFALALVFLFMLLKMQALRLEVGESTHWTHWLLPTIGLIAARELLPAIATDKLLVFGGIMFMLAALNIRLAQWGWRLWQRQALHNALWIAGPYALMGIMYAFRLINVLLGHFEAAILTQGVDALLLALTTLIASIATNMGYLGLHLERSTQAKMSAAAAQARAEENQRLSEQLTQLDRQRCLGAMSASLGHELNQPLAAILTNAQLVQRGLQRAAATDAAPMADMLERIVTNTQRASQIIERIRGFIRPRPAQCELLALQQLVPDVVKLIAAEARAQRVTITLDPHMPPLRINADAVQLSQILINVLRNAIEALADAERREIHISLREETGMAVLRIEDTGAGLSAEALARIGEPFFSTKISGLGMGVTISQTIAAQHGGDLTLTNAPGGAVATLTLPLASNNG